MGNSALKGAVQGAYDGMISGMVMGGISYGISSMQGNPMFCFVAGTTVLTTLGKKTIEAIQVGDTIPCVDHITGETTEKKVVTTTVNKVDRLIELNIDDEIIQCTETHPFQVKGKGWVDACNLNPEDIVYTKDWNIATVKSVNILQPDEPVEVFNFEVEDAHTYFVGILDLLVHNGSCTNTKTKWDIKKYSKGEVKTSYKGTPMKAQFDGHYYWLNDKAKHGNSAFKVFEKRNQKLHWAYDADEFGNFILNKHKGPVGLILMIGG